MAWLGGPDLASDVTIRESGGTIVSLSTEAPDPDAVRLAGVVLPGLVNAHSHAFHRLLRGRTHRQGGDFWLWREKMYEIARSLTPDGYERLATAVYTEMALAGITTVGEFHYLHHQMGGTPYSDHNEMGHALVRAARNAGVRICLLDAGYFAAGFDDRPLDPVQTRFSDGSAEAWLDRVEAMRAAHEDDEDVVIGLAPHSVRAVPESVLVTLVDRMHEGTPVHIHVSEQPAENRECLEATTLTPVGVLERVGLLGADTTLIHCTHLTEADIDLVGRSGSMVCYCATTERDLADGIGPARDLHESGAALCVGTDSHAVIDVFEEARGIELHTRLDSGRRGSFSPEELMRTATTAGSRSLGFRPMGLEVGAPADFIVLDTRSPRLAGMDDEPVLDPVVYSASAADVTDVFVAGRRIVADGEHAAWEEAKRALSYPLR